VAQTIEERVYRQVLDRLEATLDERVDAAVRRRVAQLTVRVGRGARPVRESLAAAVERYTNEVPPDEDADLMEWQPLPDQPPREKRRTTHRAKR